MDREPDDDEDHREEGEQAAEPGHERRDQHPLSRMSGPAPGEDGAFGPLLVATHPLTGGATASATFSVSRRRRSAVLVNMVSPMFTIWTIPDATIITPKTPRAM